MTRALRLASMASMASMAMYGSGEVRERQVHSWLELRAHEGSGPDQSWQAIYKMIKKLDKYEF